MTDFHRLIAEWYRLNLRSLPWRSTKNPYFIWLSEIILQQTKVNQGLNYYTKFINNYPTIFDLANASEQDILNDWQGLGYYSRARNLHATAKFIAFDLKGVFPNTYEEIIKLKGVGEYTAAAISSFAFDLSYSVVDGNVYRVLSRVFDIDIPIDSSEGKKYFAELAKELLSNNDPSIHNQSIMEFGAIQCLPKNPLCDICPLYDKCLSRIHNLITERPRKSLKIKVKNRYFNYLIFNKNSQFIIKKREDNDIWKHLYEFPLVETDSDVAKDEMDEIFNKMLGFTPSDYSEKVLHILSHQKIKACFYYFDKFPTKMEENFLIINSCDIQDYPLPRIIDRFLDNSPFNF